jgi:hypothetical protein
LVAHRLLDQSAIPNVGTATDIQRSIIEAGSHATLGAINGKKEQAIEDCSESRKEVCEEGGKETK